MYVRIGSIYGTGSSSAHEYYVTKWCTTYTQMAEKKWHLGEANIFENCDIVDLCARKWSGFIVNEGQ